MFKKGPGKDPVIAFSQREEEKPFESGEYDQRKGAIASAEIGQGGQGTLSTKINIRKDSLEISGKFCEISEKIFHCKLSNR